VHPLVAVILEPAAVKRAAAALRYKIDLRAARSPILGLVIARQDVDFLNGVEADRRHPPAVGACILVRASVDCNMRHAAAGSIGLGTAERVSALGLAARGARCSHDA